MPFSFKFCQLCLCEILFELVYSRGSYCQSKKGELYQRYSVISSRHSVISSRYSVISSRHSVSSLGFLVSKEILVGSQLPGKTLICGSRVR